MSEAAQRLKWIWDALNGLIEFLEKALRNIVYKVKVEEREEGREILSATTDVLLKIKTLLSKLDLLYDAFVNRATSRDKAMAAIPTEAELKEIEEKLIKLERNPLFAKLAEYKSETGSDLEQYITKVNRAFRDLLSGGYLSPETKEWFTGERKPTSNDEAWVKLWHMQFSLHDLAQYLTDTLLTAETVSSGDRKLVQRTIGKISGINRSFERVKDLLETGISVEQAMMVLPQKVKDDLSSIESDLKELEDKYPILLPLSLTEYFNALVTTPFASIAAAETKEVSTAPTAKRVINGILVKLQEAQTKLNDLVSYLEEITPQTVADEKLIQDTLPKLRNLITDCEKIKNAVERRDYAAVVKNFPTREYLGSIEDSLFRLSVNLRDFFAQSIYSLFVSIKEDFKRLGIIEVEDRFLEAAPTTPPTEKELEEEYGATPLGLADDIRTSFERVLGIFAQVYADRKSVSDFLQNLRSDFKEAMKSGDPLKLGDIYRQVSNLYLGAKLEKESEEAKQIEDFLAKLSKYIEELRRWAKQLLKFRILSEVLGYAAAKENAAS